MNMQRWITVGAIATILGGVLWLLMQLVLAATGDVTAPLETGLFIVGGVLLLIGSTGVGLWLFRPRSRALQVVTVVGAVVALLVGFNLLMMSSEAIFGAGTALGGSGGVVATALIGIVLGGLALRGSSARSTVRPTGAKSRV